VLFNLKIKGLRDSPRDIISDKTSLPASLLFYYWDIDHNQLPKKFNDLADSFV
jgi:hypothetical protein